jgi:hypothetical protein
LNRIQHKHSDQPPLQNYCIATINPITMPNKKHRGYFPFLSR